MTQTHSKIQGKFYPLQHEEWLRACRELKHSEKGVLYYIRTLDPDSKLPLPRTTEISSALRLDKATVNRALRVLGEKGYINWKPTKQDNLEQRVRDRLYTQLGGLIEVATPAGRIDLLTDTEIIEVKAIKDWKAALGQILAYSGFYPEHQKRIHLFGSAFEFKKLLDIEAACLGFEVKVTGEEV